MSRRPAHWSFAALGLLVLAVASVARADHIQSFQLPENVIGHAQFNDNSIGTPATSSNLYLPMGVAVDPVSGKLFVADSNNNRVLRFSSAAAMVTGSAAEAVLGQSSFTTSGSATTPKEMSHPMGLAFDSTGRLWVADSSNNRVLRFDNAATKATFSASADGVLGQAGLSSSTAPNPPGPATMDQPSGIATDANGTLWVGDLKNNRVLRFDQAAAKANGASADGVLGVATYTAAIGFSDTTPYSTGYPEGLAVDANGTLWVADSVGCRVLRFDHAAAKANGDAADGVLGQGAFTTNTPFSPPTSASMGGPDGLTVDASGTLWVADLNNNRVLRFDAAASKANGAPADAVLGQPDFTSNFSSDKRSGMGFPAGVALSASGDLFVVEALNGRVTRFTPKPDPVSPPAPPTASAPTIGVTGKKTLSVSKASVVLKGKAGSSEGISRVEYRVGKSPLRTASGTTAWHFKAALQPGRNTVTVIAVSNGNQTSAPVVLHITRD